MPSAAHADPRRPARPRAPSGPRRTGRARRPAAPPGRGTAEPRARPAGARAPPGSRTSGSDRPAPPPSDAPAPELFTWEFATDPYPAYAWLREHAPVHRTELPSGVEAWLVTRYADAEQALADPRLSKNPAHHDEPAHAQGQDRHPGGAQGAS